MRTVASGQGPDGVSIREYRYPAVGDVLEALRPFGINLGSRQLITESVQGKWSTTVDRDGTHTVIMIFLPET
ncbi:hypothetical protein KP696_03085 [Nocardia seriolae]|uniref:hypothetical protein n=1 Tax=Nocardia seriolae TaxID=37332 RepID=UPI003F8795E6